LTINTDVTFQSGPVLDLSIIHSILKEYKLDNVKIINIEYNLDSFMNDRFTHVEKKIMAFMVIVVIIVIVVIMVILMKFMKGLMLN
jgi:hypothetical protein